MGEVVTMERVGSEASLEKWRVRYGRKEWTFYSAEAADAFVDRQGFERGEE